VGSELDISTLLIGLAVIIFSTSLAQLFVLGLSALIRKNNRRKQSGGEGDEYQ
jgi:hypothetical protein